MLKKVGHIGIAVKNINQALAAFAKVFEVPTPKVVDVTEKKMKVALLELEGVSLEFLEDYSEAGVFKTFVEERGNAIHHFCVEIDDIEKEIDDLTSRGIEMRMPQSKIGLRGKKIIFISPNSLDGLSVELSEP